MRKRVFGRQFKRDTNERKSLFRGLMTALVVKERITTTLEKAKAIRPSIEKLVTKAKRGNGSATRVITPHLYPKAVQKFVTDIAPRFADRQGGYTRIIRVGNRIKDNAQMAVIEWTEKPATTVNTVQDTENIEKKNQRKTVVARKKKAK